MKVVSFGELLLRLSPDGHYRLFQNDRINSAFGGSEANAAVSLANFGVDSVYVTKLPDNAVGQAAIDSLRAFGVDTSHIVRGGERMGIYFLEKGASQRASLCIYDRKYSSFASARRGDFDWDEIFRGADAFHFSGITPALGDELTDICFDACLAAKKRGIKVFCDLNFRRSLWSRDIASETMSALCGFVDVLISNAGDALLLLEPDTNEEDTFFDPLDVLRYEEPVKRLFDSFGFEKAAFTVRSSVSASENDLAGFIYDGIDFTATRTYNIKIVDRIGGGDAFAAGIIYSLLSGKDMRYAADFAVAASVLKHTIAGDLNRVSVEEIESLMNGDFFGAVRR